MRMFLGENYLWRSRKSVRPSFIKVVISTKHKTDRMNSLSRMSFDGFLSSFMLIHCGSWDLFRWQLTQMNIFSGLVFRCSIWEWDIVSSDSQTFICEVNSITAFIIKYILDNFENFSSFAIAVSRINC